MATGNRLSNTRVVELLKEALAAMEIKNVNRFKIRAYQNAISILDNLTTSIYDLWENDRLDDIPGIGEGLSQHLNELFRHGIVSEWEYLKNGLPEGMFALLGIRGIGSKKAFKLSNSFNLHSRDTAIEKLKIHAENHDIQKLESFGEKSEADILESLNSLKMNKNEKPRMLLIKAEEVVERIKNWMSALESIEKIDVLGSFRRRNPTIGDLDIVVATNSPKEAIERFTSFPETAEVVTRGENKAIIVLTNDIQVDIRTSKPEEYGAMLQYNTGSKQHNIILRTFALENDLSLSEYGIKSKGKIKQYTTEEGFYKALELDYIPPELRQGTNEVELAKEHKLPNLIEFSDIKGDLQSHTNFSDGINSLGEMIAAARKLGYQYYGVSDHAPSVTSRGYKEVERLLLEQRELIDNLNKNSPEFHVLFGLEINILADAELGLPDELLKLTDYAIGSIHTSFSQDKELITKRYIAAIENPYITFLGHPTGRLINERDPIDCDWQKVFSALKSNNKIIEINAQPNRLDLPSDLVVMVTEMKIPIIINTDAHATDQLKFMKYGVDVARRSFCTKDMIINTQPYEQFVKVLKR